MSKQLVARALRALDPYGQGDSTAHLIRAVDAQYPEGYDETGGFTWESNTACSYCVGTPDGGHRPHCHRWHTRVALLALCRDITGEKE